MSTIKTWKERRADWMARNSNKRNGPDSNENFMCDEIAELRAALAASGGNAAPEMPEPLEIHWPTLNPHALGCGVEDRGLHDRYECAEYGWEDGVDRAIECVPEAIYDADQMREYGNARAAASAPNAALVAALKACKECLRMMGMESSDSYQAAVAALSAAGQEVKP